MDLFSMCDSVSSALVKGKFSGIPVTDANCGDTTRKINSPN